MFKHAGVNLWSIVSNARTLGVSLPESLSDACVGAYYDAFPKASLVAFTHQGTEFLFDTDPEFNRTVLAVGHPKAPLEQRDVSYQRGYPLVETFGGRRVDRGHFIPYTSGGTYGPNLYVQDRALNRGWSREGRQYRAIERRAATSGPDSLMFAYPLYIDDTSVPGFIQLGLVTSAAQKTQIFRNRFDELAITGADRLLVELSGATDAQVGALGEETAAVLLQDEFDAILVALGDTGLDRAEGRQDLDMVAVVEGVLVAFEVKTRYSSQRAGRVTRAGNLPRPRLRRTSTGHRQGSQPYIADRIASIANVDNGYEGVEVQLVAVDFVAMLAQFFRIDDRGDRLTPLGPPRPCRDAAARALDRILVHRGHL